MSAFHLREWKDAGENFQNMFSKLTLKRDTSTIIHRKHPIKDSVRKLEEEMKEIKMTTSAECEIVEKLREENKNLEKRLNESIAQENRKTMYKKELEVEHNILSKSKISSKDELLKENTKMRYKALRNMVQVKFLYGQKENNSLNGFVFNKTLNKIVPFSINLSTKSQEEVEERILECMEQVSGKTFCDIPFD